MSMELISREDALRETDYLILETGYDNEKVEEMLKELPTVKAIPIERLEQIREEIDKLPIYIAKFTDCAEIHICKDSVLEIIDKALKEVSNEQSDI